MKAFVIHAERLKERAEHIDRMLSEEGIECEFVNEGNDDEKIQGYLDKYMKDGRELLHRKVPRSLCTISHFLAYERILAGNMDGALVLEDDIVLHQHFLPSYKKSISEYSKNYTERPVLISYEDSSLQFVPRSQRQKGRMLYPGYRDRLSGAYFINDIAAKAILDHLLEEHCDRAIDCYHNLLIQNGFVDYLWCQPALATQGSFTGAFRSALSKKKDRMIVFRWWFKKNYKRLLYWLR
jgi:glycosyl transferase family 25